MLIPTRHENLNQNLLVLGSDIIAIFKKRAWKPWNLEDLLQTLQKQKEVSVSQFYDALLLLWLMDIVELSDYQVKISNVPAQTVL